MTASAAKIRRLGRKALRRSMPGLPWPVRPVILMYHCIDSDSFDPWGLSVSPERFAGQMEWLAANRAVLHLEEFARLHSAHSLSGKAVAITFDDGYSSFVETAAPILERLGLPATIFLPAALIGQRQEFWWDRLARLIIDFEGERLSVLGEPVDLGPPLANERHWAPYERPATRRQQLFHETWAKIRTRSLDEIDDILDGIEREAGHTPPSGSKRLMTADETRRVNSDRIKIGSHALTHPSLPALSIERKREEICGSIQRCEELTGEAPRTFAYPFGDHDAESQSLVEECGFACGCTTVRSHVRKRDRSSKLPRVGIGNWTAEAMSRVLLEI